MLLQTTSPIASFNIPCIHYYLFKPYRFFVIVNAYHYVKIIVKYNEIYSINFICT